MKRKLTFRYWFLGIFFGLQIAGITAAKFMDTRYFCWAPYDQFSIYHIEVRIDGEKLTDEKIRQRYRKRASGRNNRSIHNIISAVRQYEETYGSSDFAVVKISYEINGHKNATWHWPEDTIVPGE